MARLPSRNDPVGAVGIPRFSAIVDMWERWRQRPHGTGRGIVFLRSNRETFAHHEHVFVKHILRYWNHTFCPTWPAPSVISTKHFLSPAGALL